MSNNYKSNLTNISTELENIYDIINALPDEGSGGIDTSDATANASDIMEGQTAYVDGEKLTGTFTIDNEVNSQNALIANIKSALEGKASAAPVLQDKTITENGEYTSDSGYDGLGTVTVNVESSGGGANLNTCSISIETMFENVQISLTTVVDGIITPYFSTSEYFSEEVTNILCGSTIMITTYAQNNISNFLSVSSDIVTVDTLTSGIGIRYFVLQAPTDSSGVFSYITIE